MRFNNIGCYYPIMLSKQFLRTIWHSRRNVLADSYGPPLPGLTWPNSIIRACFSSDLMVYIPAEKTPDGIAKVVYTSKDGKSSQTFDALDWLARLVTHVPGRYEHTVRYYGYYSHLLKMQP